MRNPFIPSFSRVCETANLVMMFGVVAVSLVAVIACVLVQVSQ